MVQFELALKKPHEIKASLCRMQRGNASYESDAIIDDAVNVVVHAENAFNLTDRINGAAEITALHDHAA